MSYFSAKCSKVFPLLWSIFLRLREVAVFVDVLRKSSLLHCRHLATLLPMALSDIYNHCIEFVTVTLTSY